jgi:DNA mismatch repair protein MutS2
MASRFTAGDTVQTRFGKGVVQEVRNNGSLMVHVHGRALVVAENEISVLRADRQRSKAHPAAPEAASGSSRPTRGAPGIFREVDLHGLTVEEAIERVQQALNDALLADFNELRFVHGRSGGRIRAALHRHLRETSSVRSFRLDPRNEGVTIVSL